MAEAHQKDLINVPLYKLKSRLFTWMNHDCVNTRIIDRQRIRGKVLKFFGQIDGKKKSSF